MKTPDIEIYVKQANMKILEDWLKANFSDIVLPSHALQLFEKGKAIRATAKAESKHTELVITPQAAGKAFCSIWFKQNITPWNDDEACAMSLLAHTDVEVRCSASGWSEDEDEESAQWLLLTRSEKKRIHWG
ncbi:MAG: hypothetical protein ACMZ64_07730 [Oleiphilus sp.]